MGRSASEMKTCPKHTAECFFRQDQELQRLLQRMFVVSKAMHRHSHFRMKRTLTPSSSGHGGGDSHPEEMMILQWKSNSGYEGA